MDPSRDIRALEPLLSYGRMYLPLGHRRICICDGTLHTRRDNIQGVFLIKHPYFTKDEGVLRFSARREWLAQISRSKSTLRPYSRKLADFLQPPRIPQSTSSRRHSDNDITGLAGDHSVSIFGPTVANSD